MSDTNHTPELTAIVSELHSASVSRDTEGVSAGLTQLFVRLRRFAAEPPDCRSDRALAASWLLTKCAENLRELEWQMTRKWDEVERTADMAARCVVQLSEAV